MTQFKKLRFYYWLLKAFLTKNLTFIIISFVSGFFVIFLLINFYPFFTKVLTYEKEVIGIVGDYSLSNPPSEITTLISNPLISVNEKGEIIPLLINSWELLEGGKEYRFHLKNGLFWNDKKLFTAFETNYNFKGIDVKVSDSNTLEFRLNQPLSIFPIYLTKPLLKYPLIGVAGVYRVQSFKISKDRLKEIHLYPNKERLPYKTYKFYQSDDALITAYKKGEITTFQTSKRGVNNTFAGWKNTKITKSIDYSQIVTLFFNTKSEFLQDRDARHALVLATPLHSDYGQEASGPIPPTSWAFSKKNKQYPYDPEKAASIFGKNKLASEAAQLSFYTFYDYLPIAEEIKKAYEKLGLRINLKVLSYLPDNFDMLLTAWNPPQDPDQYFFWHSTQGESNITNYKNVKVDKYLEDGRKTINIAQRKRIYIDFQKAILDDLPAFFMYYPTVYTVKRK